MDKKIKQSTILIVDDNPSNISVAANYLKTEGYHISSASNGATAITRAQRIMPDLILLDINMPEMNGYEVCETLKGSEDTINIPIVFLTAANDGDAKEKAFLAGGVDYLTKPFSRQELLSRVKTHLSIQAYRLHLESLVTEKTNALALEIEEHKKSNVKLSEYRDQLEIKVADRTNDLSSALKELKDTQKELVRSEKMASLAGLIAGIAHEINTPAGVGISAISSFEEQLDSLKSSFDNEKLTSDELVNFILNSKTVTQLSINSFNRISTLVKTFKELAQNDWLEGYVNFNLHDFLSTHALNNREDNHINIDWQTDKSLTIKNNPFMLQYILQKLFNNSKDHGFSDKDNKQVTIKLYMENKELYIDYQDNGIGIEPDNFEHIFEPFYTTKRGQGSVGLGLHILFILITQRLKGGITCLESNTGAHFLAHFPVEEAAT